MSGYLQSFKGQILFIGQIIVINNQAYRINAVSKLNTIVVDENKNFGLSFVKGALANYAYGTYIDKSKKLIQN